MAADHHSLLIVGQPGPVHVGGHLQQAAESLGLRVAFCDVTAAFAGPKWLTRLSWRLREHRPVRMREFNAHVVRLCERDRPRWLLVTGVAPLQSGSLQEIGRLGIERINYLTDDPWNPAHYAKWFLESLRDYDRVFSPRIANLEDLRAHGCSEVGYLPFAYAPYVHFAPRPLDELDDRQGDVDVVFAGGADRDRVPYIDALAQAGVSMNLYGGYWNRYSRLGNSARGIADPPTLREATFSARMALCIVRRANRDGHVMRSFEIPAVGACMLAEDTSEHRRLFGGDGGAIVYFRTAADLVERARWLLAQPAERMRLRHAAHAAVSSGRHTYQDRLAEMLRLTEVSAAGTHEVARG